MIAALTILYSAILDLIRGPEVDQLSIGLLITGGLAMVNLALGTALIRIGRSHDSIVLVANGKHVLTSSCDGTAIQYDVSKLFKDIPARIEFLLALQTHHASALSTGSAATRDETSLEILLNFAAYVNSRPRLKGRILRFI